MNQSKPKYVLSVNKSSPFRSITSVFEVIKLDEDGETAVLELRYCDCGCAKSTYSKGYKERIRVRWNHRSNSLLDPLTGDPLTGGEAEIRKNVTEEELALLLIVNSNLAQVIYDETTEENLIDR